VLRVLRRFHQRFEFVWEEHELGNAECGAVGEYADG
jgi:hypothetical protein